jgi:hypothetical protein
MEESTSAKETSVEPSDDAVKKLKPLHKSPLGPSARPPGFARLLEGWELGAITVGMVLSAALLAVPRAAPPGVFPVPLLDVAEGRAARARSSERVARAQREGLPFETRAVGDAVRRLGLALSGGNEDAEHVQAVIEERVQAALSAGQIDALLRLRAVQSSLFVRAAREHRLGAPASAELRALGGDFATRAQRDGWLSQAGYVASDDELAALFERRWVEITRLREHPRFKATLTELRRHYRFLLLYPERGPGTDSPVIERARMRLRYVEALARRDTEYPVSLARGSLLAEMGLMPDSAQALNRQLARPGSAVWNLRARNYLLYAARGQPDFSGDLAPAPAP